MILKSSLPEIDIPDIGYGELVINELSKRDNDNSIALIDGDTDQSFTFGQIKNLIIKCANAFKNHGIEKGDYISTCIANCVEFPVIVVGAALCGAVVVTCNPVYTEGEISFQFRNVPPKLVIVDAAIYKKVQSASNNINSVKEIITIGQHPSCDSLSDWVKAVSAKDFQKHVPITLEDTCLVFHSSGTTGLPKAVMVSHKNLVFRAQWNSAQDQIRIYNILREVVLPALSPEHKQIASGGAALPEGVAKAVQEKLNVKIRQGWGLTEGIFTVALQDNIPLHSVGRPIPNTEVKIIDETGKTLGPMQHGEICGRNPLVSKGYYNNPLATSQIIDKEGWLHSGDIGYFDHSGNVYVIGRSKELIKYKGFQVAPAELEQLLLQHPNITDAAVIGIPDIEAGELPKAFLVTNDKSLTEQDIHQFVKRKAAPYKQLKGGIEFCNEIPKTATGKILRRLLKSKVNQSKL